MRSKLMWLLLPCMLFSICLSAQKKKRGEIPNRVTCTFGDVRPEDFTPTAYAVDSSAEAVFLFDGGTSTITASKRYGWDIIRKVHVKMRVLKKAAFHLATVRFGLYVTSDFQEQYNDLKAATYNISNGTVQTTSVSKSDIYQERQDDKYVVVKFTFPNVIEGSIIEYDYSITTPGANNLEGWDFQNDYPVLWSEYQVSFPSLFNYVVLKRGYQPYMIDTVTLTGGSFALNQERGEGVAKTSETLSISCQVANCLWAMKNVPPLKEEPFTTTLENHRAKINFQLSSIQYSETDVTNYLHSWAGVADTLTKEDFYLGKAYVTGTGFLDNDVRTAVANETDDLQKAKKIYEWVRDNYTATDTRPWLEQPLRKVYQSKKGNTAEVNSILLVMLKEAGLQAYPVLLSTTNHGKTDKEYPLLRQYNHTICDVIIADKNYLLDASNSKLGFNKLSPESYNGYARVINPANPELINLSADSLKEYSMTSVFITNSDNHKMAASVNSVKGYEESLSLRNRLVKESKDVFYKNIKKSFSDNIAVSNENIDSLQLLDMPVKVNYDLTLDNNDDDIIYFNPMLGDQQKENPFAAAERYYPVEMPYCNDETYVLNMEVPQGYTVDELPKSARVKLNENEGMFEYMIAKSGDRIQLRCRVKLGKATYEPDDYQTLRDFFGFVVKKEAEQIVFKKIK